jgi:hypothetical protein
VTGTSPIRPTAIRQQAKKLTTDGKLPPAEDHLVELKNQLDDTKRDLENIQPLRLLLPDEPASEESK